MRVKVWIVRDESDYYMSRVVGVFSSAELADAGEAEYREQYRQRIAHGRPVNLDMTIDAVDLDVVSCWLGDFGDVTDTPAPQTQEDRDG